MMQPSLGLGVCFDFPKVVRPLPDNHWAIRFNAVGVGQAVKGPIYRLSQVVTAGILDQSGGRRMLSVSLDCPLGPLGP